MNRYNHVSIDSIISRFYRDARGNDLSETDLIEWVGDAVDFMKLPSASEEAIAFLEVKDYHALLPNRIHYVIQVARDMHYDTKTCVCPAEVLVNSEIQDTIPQVLDCDGKLIENYSLSSQTPYFDMSYSYSTWNNSSYLQDRYCPVRLANHTLFGSLVCKDNGISYQGRDEYTIVGDRIRFNFEQGAVAIPYIRQKVDDKGYPMVPDNQYSRAAVNYYLIWKMKEREKWNHKEGAGKLAAEAKQLWDEYIGKFLADAKMPKGIDQHQNLMDQGNYLIPRRNRYYGFFGKLGEAEMRPFNNPTRNQGNRLPDVSTPSGTTTIENKVVNESVIAHNSSNDVWDGDEW